jgi:hypothetical protein
MDRTKMNKERPTELNKKIKRLQESRDNLKIKNREKNLLNQKLRDRNIEISESRNQWKTRNKELYDRQVELEQRLQAAQESVECERIRADKERQRADDLQAEIEIAWKKKSRA